ncbi:hypothetical protein [Klebsiella quasipneumoniae]|nr:hypothetical protein [Klebsiella quasipneumoniae]
MATKGSGSSSMACGAVHRQTPEAGARCVNRARRDLCGGYPVTGIPTATFIGGKIMLRQSDIADKTPDHSENRLWMMANMGRVL